MTIISSPHDFRRAAQARVPRFLFDYADGGAGSEMTLRANSEDLARIGLKQRVLRDVSDIDLSTDLLGARRPLPLAAHQRARACARVPRPLQDSVC